MPPEPEQAFAAISTLKAKVQSLETQRVQELSGAFALGCIGLVATLPLYRRAGAASAIRRLRGLRVLEYDAIPFNDEGTRTIRA
jgi:hypothetical protein